MDEVEGEVREVESAVIVVPREALAATVTPEDTIVLASRMATALSDVVERQRLYALIQGKKYPQVEAWMTIGRMDNVVAREASNPERHEDGSYEAVVELIRLSDGMVIGRGSALCGTKGDKPWDTRPEPARRSMSVTRATSRAFRQQYSWIMALAGYEPTPADEMPHDSRDVTPRDAAAEREHTNDGSLIGTVTAGKPPVDLELRQTPDGPICGFKLAQGRSGIQVLAAGALADALHPLLPGLRDQRVSVWGSVVMIPWAKDGKDMPPYKRLNLERIATADFVLPAEHVEAPSDAMFPDAEEAAAIAAAEAAEAAA